jgi:hypothetical protein
MIQQLTCPECGVTTPGTIIVKESTDEQQAAQAPLQGGPALSDQG